MNTQGYTPDDDEMVGEIRALTGWGPTKTQAFIKRLDALPTVVRRRQVCLKQFADQDNSQQLIPIPVLKMENHYSSERVRWQGNTRVERAIIEPQRVPEPDYRTSSNNTGAAVWLVYSQTRSAQSRERSARLMQRQLA